MEVSEYEPDSRFGLRMIEGPLLVHARLGFEHLNGGTRLFFTVHGEPSGAMRLAQPLLRHALRRQFKQHCANLKRVLEKGA